MKKINYELLESIVRAELSEFDVDSIKLKHILKSAPILDFDRMVAYVVYEYLKPEVKKPSFMKKVDFNNNWK